MRVDTHAMHIGLCIVIALITVVLPLKIQAAISLTYTDNATDATNLTTYTFASMDFGAASSDRIMVAAIIGGGTAATINSVTIGGVSASRVVQANNSNSNSAEIWTAAVPTGTSGDVVVVWSTGIARSGVSLYQMTGAEATAIDTDTTGATNNLSAQFDLNQTINTVTGGAVVSVAYQGYFDPGTWSWTGLTEDVEANVETDRSMTSASLSASSDETNRAVSTAFSIDTGAHNAVMVTASWEPTPDPTPVLSKPSNNLGLVGYWSFNDGAGTVATDFSGNGNHGTLDGPPLWTNGTRGRALNFDGTDDFVRVANPTTFNFGTANFTIVAWVKRRVIGEEHMIISKSDESSWATDGKLFNISATNRLFLDQNGVGFESSSATIVDTNWHHVVVTFNDTTNSVLFYIDGVLDGGGGTLALTADNGAHVVKIGRLGTDPAIDGALDEVRVYNRVLSASEIGQLYSSGAVRMGASTADLQKGTTLETGLVGHWTFDGADITNSTVSDKSPEGNHGYATATSTMKGIGKLGQGLTLNGTSDYVRIPYDASLQFNTGSFTLAAWIKTSDTNEAMIMARDTTGNPFKGWQFAVSRDNGVVGSLAIWPGVFDPGWFENFGANVADGQWHHVAATYDGSVFRLYKDGALLDTSGVITVDYSSTDPMVIGSRLNGAHGWFGHFDGSIDDVRTYNRQLSGSEMQQLYRLGFTRISN